MDKEYTLKDSGKREMFTSGMVRDVTGDKTNMALVFDGPMLWRWAHHLTLGAVKYAKRNWMLAAGESELERFKESAARHFAQWYRGDSDEDHAAAVIFNLNGAEYVKDKLRHALVESESVRSAGPKPPASQRTSQSPDRLRQPWAPLPVQQAGTSPLTALDLCQADHESERHKPGPDDEGQMAQSAIHQSQK